MKAEYTNSKSDLFAAFIERCLRLTWPGGAAALITMQSWMFLSSYEKLRYSLLAHNQIISMLHLGSRAFDSIGGEVVSSTAFILNERPTKNQNDLNTAKGIFVRLVEGLSESEKTDALHVALACRNKNHGYYLASNADFAEIPGSPIVYWLSEKMRATFNSGRPLSEVTDLRQGLATADNNRFLRQWWEVSQHRTDFICTSREEAATSGARWFPYNKGGEFRKWYGNHEYVVNWENDGAEIREFGMDTGGRPRSRAQNTATYFSPSVSWSDVSSGSPSFRCFPAGFIHGNKGNSIFGDEVCLEKLSVILNSVFATFILEGLAPTMTSTIGDVAKFPILNERLIDGQFSSRQLVAGSKVDWNSLETAWDYECNPLVVLAKQ